MGKDKGVEAMFAAALTRAAGGWRGRRGPHVGCLHFHEKAQLRVCVAGLLESRDVPVRVHGSLQKRHRLLLVHWEHPPGGDEGGFMRQTSQLVHKEADEQGTYQGTVGELHSGTIFNRCSV